MNAYRNYVSMKDWDGEERNFYYLDESIKDVSDELECSKYLKNLLS